MDTILGIFEYILPFVVLTGILVTAHEWGHYYAARSIGVAATHFSVGFGPVLWSRVDAHGTRWQVCLLPVGGYVRFLGDADGTSAGPTASLFARAETMPDAERRRYFHLRSPGDRAWIIFAGPAVNLFLGFLIISTLYVTLGRPVVPPVVSGVVEGMPAAKAGILPGDRVVAVNGRQVRYFADIFDEVALYPEGKVDIVVERKVDDATPRRVALSMTSTPVKVRSFGVEQTVGRIGIENSGVPEYEYMGPLDSIVTGTGDVWKLTKGMLVGVSQIVTGKRPLADVGGPVRMAEMSGSAAKAGFVAFVFLMAAISINLAVFNLLPVPALDGSQLVVCAVEALTRRPVSERTLSYLNKAGVVALVSLMAMLTVSDVMTIFQRLTF